MTLRFSVRATVLRPSAVGYDGGDGLRDRFRKVGGFVREHERPDCPAERRPAGDSASTSLSLRGLTKTHEGRRASRYTPDESDSTRWSPSRKPFFRCGQETRPHPERPNSFGHEGICSASATCLVGNCRSNGDHAAAKVGARTTHDQQPSLTQTAEVGNIAPNEVFRHGGAGYRLEQD